VKEFKPIAIFLSLLSIFACMALIGFYFPKEGIYLNESFSLRFPQLNSFFTDEKKTDISKILTLNDTLPVVDTLAITAIVQADSCASDTINANDSLAISDTIANQKYGEIKDPSLKLVTPLEYKDGNKSCMNAFFYSLANEINVSRTLHILHYGDSQIESDRITDFLRMKLQAQFGGEGRGFVAITPVSSSHGLRQTWSNNWERYTLFTGRDKRIKHMDYGVGASFSRFVKYDSANDSSKTNEAWIKIKTTKTSNTRLSTYTKVKLFYGNALYKTNVEFYEDGVLTTNDSLLVGGFFNSKQFTVSTVLPQFEIKFKGKDSPDIYGVSLEGNGGIIVDNFGLRGSSGTFFNKLNSVQLKSFYDQMNVKLFIIQFGENTLPYTKNKTQTDYFGKHLESQIKTLKKMVPNASVIVIGPADMSVKEGTEYVTHPQLENLRDAIRLAAFNTNSAFFDMYECMGGKNSMVSWVDAGIAAKDYIHFSSTGARKIATILYSAIINDFNEYVRKQAK